MKTREYMIPEEHHEQVATLSRANNHASLRMTLAQARWQRAMQEAVAGQDDAVLALYDEYKARIGEANAADKALWDFLEDLEATIKSDRGEDGSRDRWALKADDKTLVRQMEERGNTLPTLPRVRPGLN